jgi:hypothetical protein
MDGLVFDAGFTADYHLIARRGNAGSGNRFDLDFANLVAQSATAYGDVFAGFDQGVGTTGTGVNAVPITLAYNGSNTGGVTGAAPGAANQDDLADLGYTAGSIKVLVGINGSSHNFWSNQFLGGLPAPQGNLGGDEAGGFTGEGAIDLTHFAGDQYFTVVVPEPSAAVFAGVALAGWLGARRRRS